MQSSKTIYSSNSAPNKLEDSSVSKKSRPYAGVHAVVVTPCRAPGVIDPEAMQVLTERLSLAGCCGIFVAGSTGESTLLAQSERRALTVAARAGIQNDTLLSVGVTGMGLKDTIHNCRSAAEDGADLVVAMVPYYFTLNQTEIAAYFTAIADASPLPVVLYHHPRATTPLAMETITTLSQHENIVAVKHTSVSLAEIKQLIEATKGSNIAVLQGNEKFIVESFALGATDGMLTALAGIIPEWHVELYNAMKRKDHATVVKRSESIDALWEMFRLESRDGSISSFVYSLKLALKERGWLKCMDPLFVGYRPSELFQSDVIALLNRLEFNANIITTPFRHSGGNAVRIDPAEMPPINTASEEI